MLGRCLLMFWGQIAFNKNQIVVRYEVLTQPSRLYLDPYNLPPSLYLFEISYKSYLLNWRNLITELSFICKQKLSIIMFHCVRV
jgi:hypothetical protein